MTLTIRTDNPEAALKLWNEGLVVAELTWTAHRELAATLHKKIDELLSAQKGGVHSIDGVIVYSGPGSFTGLRIGVSVANALGYSLQIPVVGTSGEEWEQAGFSQLNNLAPQTLSAAVPHYGVPAITTSPKK